MEKSLDALRNIKTEGVADTNPKRYLVTGVTSEGMEILWVFEIQNNVLTGNVISIYPQI